MPSPESDALRAQFAAITELSAANPEMPLPVLQALFDGLAAQTAEPEDVTYAETNADGVPALWCLPQNARPDVVLFYTHGGGFVANGPSSHRKLAAHLAKAVGARALVIDYRLAPVHPFPAQLDDAVTAYRWLKRTESGAIVAAGDSAGGNLAITTVLRLRDLGDELPAAVVAFSPWTDLEHGAKTLDSNASTDALISRSLVEQLAALYLGDHASPQDPLVSPLRADLRGFPPTYITVGDAEALLEDSTRFAEALRAANVAVELEVSPGQQHIYPLMAGRAPEADATIAAIGAWTRSLLGSPAENPAAS